MHTHHIFKCVHVLIKLKIRSLRSNMCSSQNVSFIFLQSQQKYWKKTWHDMILALQRVKQASPDILLKVFKIWCIVRVKKFTAWKINGIRHTCIILDNTKQDIRYRIIIDFCNWNYQDTCTCTLYMYFSLQLMKWVNQPLSPYGDSLLFVAF